MNRSVSYSSSPPAAKSKPARMGLKQMHSYQVSTSLDVIEFLPATTYSPPSPRGRLVADTWVRPSLRLDAHMMPSPEEIIEATNRHRRSSSTSSNSSMSSFASTSSTRSEKRQGRLFLPNSGGIMDPTSGDILGLLMENRELEDIFEP